MKLTVRVDRRLWPSLGSIPEPTRKAFEKDLREMVTYDNPDFHKKHGMGYSTHGVPRRICLFENESVPRGLSMQLRRVALDHGIKLEYQDFRTTHPAEFSEPKIALRQYQQDAIAACLLREQGIVRAPTGSGKTTAALGLIAQAGQRALVIMRDSRLLQQWKIRCVSELGLRSREIGELQGSKRRHGARLTLALQQTLYGMDASELEDYGIVIVDEVQTVAARTFQETIDKIPAKYRIGFSADETRKDKKEFLIYGSMGAIIHSIERSDLERDSVIVPVKVRLVETTYEAEWYRNAKGPDRNFNRLLDDMAKSETRNASVIQTIMNAEEEGPTFVFTHRREFAKWLADDVLFLAGKRCGLLMGGAGDAIRFEEDRERLRSGEIRLACGTINAIGTGIDIPNVSRGVMATPIGNNRQYFNQVIGRLCRTAPGKKDAILYFIWDKRVLPNQAIRVSQWVGADRVEIMRGGRWTKFK